MEFETFEGHEKKQKEDETITIPKDYYVTMVDFDSQQPFVNVVKDGEKGIKKISVPKALAFFLSNNSGSRKMTEKLRDEGVKQIQNGMKELLGL